MKTGVLGRAAGIALSVTTAVAGLALAVAPASSAATRSVAPTSPTAVSRTTSAVRVMKEGLSGSDVLALQRRLSGLHYWPGVKIDGKFTHDTTEAVWAFQAINGLAEDGQVGPATAKALAHPRAYRSQYPHGAANRIEVNINAKVQVLVYYKNNAIALISHVSSGCGPCGPHYGYTPTGTYTANIFMPGWVTVPLGAMYNPVFFIGTKYAIHGDTSVPKGPASHGCVRIPDNLAKTFHTLITVRSGSGTQIDIYNRAP